MRTEAIDKLYAAQAAADAEREREHEAQRAEEKPVINEMISYIGSTLKQSWRIPSTATDEMSAVVAINLFPSGEIDQAYIETSSGDQSFDRSALQAVFRTERFERIADIDPILFERSFKRVLIAFRP